MPDARVEETAREQTYLRASCRARESLGTRSSQQMLLACRRRPLLGRFCDGGSVLVGCGECTRSDEQVLGRPSYGYVLDDGGWHERQGLRMLILNMCRRRRRGRRPPTVGEKGFFARPGPPAVGTTPTDRTGVRQTSGPGSTIHADGDDNDADDERRHTCLCTRQQVRTQRRAWCNSHPRLAACAHLEGREAQTGGRHPAGLLWAARCRLAGGVSPWPPALPRL
jgi:hypothetical protein